MLHVLVDGIRDAVSRLAGAKVRKSENLQPTHFSLRGRNRGHTGILLFLTSFLLCAVHQQLAAQSFSWPVNPQVVGQVYADYNNGATNKYHTGMDISSGITDYTTTVTAARGGVVHKIFGVFGLSCSTALRRWNSSTNAYTWDTQPITDNLGQSYNTDNHGLGIAVIIYHADLRLYTLYGHLDAVVAGLLPGQTVAQGAPIGKMGNSAKSSAGVGYLRFSTIGIAIPTPQGSPPCGYATWGASGLVQNNASGFGLHVHFEVKDRGVLSARRTDDEAPDWGYTSVSAPGTIEKPGHPNFYGYHDPNIFLTRTVTKLPAPLAIELSAGTSASIRDFPSTSSTLSLVITQITSRADGKLPAFSATRSVSVGADQWYQVFLPNASTEGWSASGWIAGTVGGVTYSQANNALPQVKVTDESAYLYASASTSSSKLAVVYGQPCSAAVNNCGALLEGQQFVPFESPSGWYRVYAPQKAPQSDGWILSSAVTYIPGSVSTYTLNVNSSGATGVTISSSTLHGGVTNYSKTALTSGTTVQLTAPTTSGSANFSSWTGCDTTSSTACTISMNGTRTATAGYTTCTYTLSASNASFSASASADSVGVTTTSACNWTASSNVSWLTVASGPFLGSSSVNYSVAANTSTSPRTGTLTLAGQTYTVTQAGATSLEAFPPNCQLPSGWTMPSGANAGWSVVTNEAFEGTCSLKSNPILDSQTAQIQFAGNLGAGNITFSRKVSSEDTYDCFRFYVDGIQQSVGGTCVSTGGVGASGEVPWGLVTVPVAAGFHTLIWSYEKDSCCTGGSMDAAWIDAVVLPTGAAAPVVSFSPSSLNFSNQNIGTTSAAQFLTLTNSGNAILNIINISSSGDFVLTNVCPNSLAIGASCNLNVAFTPTASGARTGSILVTSDSAGSPHAIPLNGTGILSTLPSAPTLISVTPGSRSATFIFTAPTNNGGTAIVSYTATCTSNGQATRTTSGPGSPLTVFGLVGGVGYVCSVNATNAGGSTSSASSTFLVTPTSIVSTGAIMLLLLD